MGDVMDLASNKPFVIAIAAISGGGKTTVVSGLAERLSCPALSYDDYDLEGPNDFIAWTRRGGDCNEWNVEPMVTDLRQWLDSPSSTPAYILLDYPHAYLNDRMKDFIDLAIFIDTPLDVGLCRRVARDFSDAAADDIREELARYAGGAREAYLIMLETVKPASDVVLDGTLEPQVLVEQILNMLPPARAI